MKHPLSIRDCVIIVTLVQLAAGKQMIATEWRYFSPILSSQVHTLGRAKADSMLEEFCRTPVQLVSGVGPTCRTRRLGPAFADIIDRRFHPEAIIFGHFLGPDSDDAAVSGWSAETHPDLWGGALLLNRRADSWTPVSYRSGVIIDSCEKTALPDHREILLCEAENSGMGHAVHYLYTVDFEHPSRSDHGFLAKAESFKDDCVSQNQILKGFHWRPDSQEFSVEIDTTEWSRLSTEPYCANYPKRRPASVRVTFAVTSYGVRELQAEPAAKQ
jgi:hypothetical protein